jgi:hypothetical protein
MEAKPRPTVASSTTANWSGFRSDVALGTIWSVLVVSKRSTGCSESEAEELDETKARVLTQLPDAR